MLNFAQVELSEVGTACLNYYDQSSVIVSFWFGMLLLSLALAIGFFLLKRFTYGSIFATGFVLLVAARILNPADDCGHGGLFEFSEQGFIGFGIFSLIIFITLILGIYDLWKSRSLKSDA